MTSYPFLKMAAMASQTLLCCVFSDITRLIYLIPQLSYYYLVSENKRLPYWNFTSKCVVVCTDAVPHIN